MRYALAIVFLWFAQAGTWAQSVHFPSVAVGGVAAGPQLSGWLYRPAGEGPFPAIVLAHTCAGVSEHTDVWGKLLASWGYVTVAPDSFGPRGEKTVCNRGTLISADSRVTDVAGAMDFLNAQPFVRRHDIGLIGHSHGGWTTMRAVQKRFDLAARGLRAAVAYYPYCSPPFDRGVAVPLLIMVGEKDDWTPADNCRKLQAGGFARPELVEAIYYPKAYHSFDSKIGDRTYLGHHLAYDTTAAPDAEARAKAWFEKYLR